MKKILYFLLSSLLCCITVISSIGFSVSAETVYSIEYDKDAQKLVKSSGDPFIEIKNMIPGDSKTVTIELKNSALTARELSFYSMSKEGLTQTQKELLSQIGLSISMNIDGKTSDVFSGQMISLNSTEPELIKLGRIGAGKSATFKATVSVPATFDNSYADSQIPVLWKFYVSDSGLKVDTPIATPVGGTYDKTQQVELTCETEGATIYYTTDGKTPTNKSQVYSNTKITVDSNTIIKAFAVKDEYEDSDVMTETYKIKCYPPVATPQGSTYDNAQQVTLTTKTPSGVIYYTTDGTQPTTASTKYTSPITIDENTVLKAITTKENCENSDVTTENYKIKCAPPVATPKSGTYDNSEQVTLTTTTTDGVIYYTTDGSQPTKTSNRYSTPITINENTVLKAITTKDNCENSDTLTETYKIKCAPPIATPQSGTYNDGQKIVLTTKTIDGKIYYTIDGSQPSTSSALYNSPIPLNENTILKAITVKDNCENSDITTENYKIKCAPPEITPKSGTYDTEQNVVISTTTPNGIIHYTTNGSDPSSSSPIYSSPITVDKNSTVKAITTKDNCEDSSVSKETYKIKSQPPIISPESGEYDDTVEVIISSPEENAVIHYTTDGSAPTENSEVYDSPIIVDKETTIKAISSTPDRENSDPVSEKYTIKLSPPDIRPDSGTFTERASIIIVHELPDVQIRYTLDGTEPTKDSQLYTGAFEITEDTTVTAKAFKPKTIESDPTSENYKIEAPINNLEPPVISPVSGTYPEKIQVTITHPDPNVIIRYTETGEEPTENSPIYTGSFEVENNTSVSAKAYPSEGQKSNPSRSVTETYKFILTPPVISPEGGTYEEKVEVVITHPDPDVIIRYTTDGTKPTEESPVYKTPIIVDKSEKVTAKAYSYTKLPSIPVSEDYIVRAAEPDITPESGEYPDEITVTITHTSPDAVIHYTVDGSKPDENSPVYIKPFIVTSNTTVTAIAVIPDNIPSNPVKEDYKIKLSPPSISPEGNTFTESVQVVIVHKDENVIIKYTVDGTTPDENSKTYTGPFDVTKNTTVKAIATKEGNTNSDEAKETYQIKVNTPVISPKGDEFEHNTEISVSITCSTPNSTIYYTIDGSEPTRNAIKYIGQFPVNSDTTVKAIAVCDDMLDSNTAEETYYFCGEDQVARPKARPSGGEYDEEVTVKLTCSTPGAIIYYTTDGKTPTTDSKIYTKPIPVDEYTVIKAFAVKEGMKDSRVMKEEYSFKVAAPKASPVGGTYNEIQYVTLTCDTEYATIYYTIDGSEPTEYSTEFIKPIEIAQDSVLKAFAVRDGWEDSDAITETYTIYIIKEEPPAPVESEPPAPEEPTPIPEEPVKTGVESAPITNYTSIIFIVIGFASLGLFLIKKRK